MPRKVPGFSKNTIHSSLDKEFNLCEIDKASYIKINLLGAGKDKQFIISIESMNKVLKHDWYLNQNSYPYSYTAIYHNLHRFLLGRQEKGMVIDHINRDRLDNRLDNLRVITAQENSFNKTKSKTSQNKYKGVKKSGNKFTASITKDGKTKQIGGFATEDDAAKAYDMMAEELFGEFASKNFND